MTEKQYSDLQRQIGVLEGLGYVFENQGGIAALYWDAIEVIDGIIEEIKNGKKD